MSLAREDWKRFCVLSGQVKVGDAANSGDVICNVSDGDWVAMCEYDDDNRIRYVAAMRDYLAENMADGSVEVEGTSENGSFESKSGVVFIIDRKLDGDLHGLFEVPEDRLNPLIVGSYGKPGDEGKASSDSFMESMFHMGRDHRSSMPVLESLNYGAVFELGRGIVDVGMIYNAKRDVIGFEITRKDG